MTFTARFAITLAAVALLGVACNPEQSTAGPSTTTAPPTATTSTVLDSGRSLEIVSCASVPDDMEILCESYDLIRMHYVDALDDQLLAEAASIGLTDLEATDVTGDLICAIPADAFAESCTLAGQRAKTSTEAAEAMVLGLTNYALDANSVYLDEEALALVQEEQEGEIEGIGALVSAEDHSTGEAVQCSIISDTCQLIIVSTVSGSPAEAAGLLRDDQIVKVDGADISDWTIDEVTASVRGPSGTEVTITISRGDERFDVTITRAAIIIPVVESETIGSTGYLRLNLFTDNADEQFEEAVTELLDQDIDSLVVDLRDNPGGLLDTAIAITSQFLAEGDVVITQSPDSDTSYEVSGRTTVPEDMNVVFIVNRGSASASELVSAVLQERGRITVVGENTFGKNTVQQRFGLSNGGALKLTIARWVTPAGLDFGGVGVTPDFEEVFEPNASAEEIIATALAVG